MAVLTALAEHISVDISAIEAKHASNREMTMMRARGWSPSVATLSAKFISRTVHAMETIRKWFHGNVTTGERSKDDHEDDPPKKRNKPRKHGGGAWRAFCHERCKGTQFSAQTMSQLSVEYKQLTAQQRQVFEAAGKAATLAAKFGMAGFGQRRSRKVTIPKGLDDSHEPRPQQQQPGDVTESGAIVCADGSWDIHQLMAYQGPDFFLEQLETLKGSVKQEFKEHVRAETVSENDLKSVQEFASGATSVPSISQWKDSKHHLLSDAFVKTGEIVGKVVFLQWLPPVLQATKDGDDMRSTI